MIRLRSAAVCVAASAFLLTGCDTQGITIVAEVFETFEFEDGLSGWTGGGEVGGLGEVSVEPSTEAASGGTSSARLRLIDPSGSGVVWMVRQFDGLAPDREYTIELEFDFGSSDTGSATPWSVVAAAAGQDVVPVSSLNTIGTTQVLDESDVAFEARTASLVGTTDEEGRMFIFLGVAQDTEGSRLFFVDDLTVRLTRR